MSEEKLSEMENVKEIKKDGFWEIVLSGRVDSANSPRVEEELLRIVNDHPGEDPLIDAEDLEYISSAGLRVLLHL